MTHPSTDESREKLLVNLAPELRRDLRIRAAEHGLNMQDATASAISAWLEQPPGREVETYKPKSWGVFLPLGMPSRFTAECDRRGVTKTQGIAQAITFWLEAYPTPATRLTEQPVQRILVGNQKGGVGKTFISLGLAQACAEAGKRVLLVDYDPQGHLSSRLKIDGLPPGGESLLTHMKGKAERHIARSLVALPHERFGGRLHVLPADTDAFLMDADLAVMQIGRDRALTNALAPIEADYDVVILDGPPNLGMAMDLAIHYVQRRPGELIERSGMLIPVWTDKASFNAYSLLTKQIAAVEKKTEVVIDQLGFVVNAYDSRKGTVARAFYDAWSDLTTPGTLATLKDAVEGREASDYEIPLLEYAPDCQQAQVMRTLAKELTA